MHFAASIGIGARLRELRPVTHAHHVHILGLRLGSFFGWLALLVPAAVIGVGAGRLLGMSARIGLRVTPVLAAVASAILRY
jgi:hypothetical protein